VLFAVQTLPHRNLLLRQPIQLARQRIHLPVGGLHLPLVGLFDRLTTWRGGGRCGGIPRVERPADDGTQDTGGNPIPGARRVSSFRAGPAPGTAAKSRGESLSKGRVEVVRVIGGWDGVRRDFT
jgi:hypothetical protein